MMDIKGDLLVWFTKFLIKSPQAAVLIRMGIMSVLWTQLKNYTNQLLENLNKNSLFRI